MNDLDTNRADEFAGRLLTILNSGALSLMVSIGHRTGLFDAMSTLPASTSAEIAAAAGLDERYVREWLGAMVTAEIVEVDAASRLYGLPAEHAAHLTRAAGPDNMATTMQYVGILGTVEDEIVDRFLNGGGVPYSKYPRLQAVLAEDSEQFVVSSLETHVLPMVPGLVDRLRAGIDAVDLGCGSGRTLNALARLFPQSRFTGFDLSVDAVAAANAEAAARRLPNCTFHVRDLSDFDRSAPEGAFDLVMTFDAVHDHPHPLVLLRGIHRSLADRGVYLMQEIRGSSFVRNNIGHPLGTLLYTVSTMHCMTVSLAQQGEGFGAMWGEEKARECLAEAGFGSVETREVEHDLMNTWYIVRK